MGVQFLKNRPVILRNRGLMLSLLVLICLLCSSINLHAEQVAVIVIKDGPLSHISKAEIRGIYLGEIRFVGGMPVRPIQYPEGQVKDAFLSNIIGMSAKDYKLYWVKKLFQEGLTPPLVKTDPAEIMNAVREDPWGIGYLPKELASEASDIQIIYIIQEEKH
ncbi:MAG TPA: hypothetical protein VFH55_05295 [Nitrospiria bacterium]|nr:hypothetical protein [Nitrospiria bacterium]